MDLGKPETYWEQAGTTSYAEAMFSHSEVERHINGRLWQIGVEIGKSIGLNAQSHLLDLGCGDGALANLVLAKHFHAIDGFDLSQAAIQRAQTHAANTNMTFKACDITQLDFQQLPSYHGAYLWGILHHIKSKTPDILKRMQPTIKRLVVLEPNGNHLVRKLLEHTAAYKAAGEDSFRTKELEKIFSQAGYRPVIWKRVNLFPNFTPLALFHLLKNFEPVVEKTPLLRSLCTVNMWGLIAHE